VNLTALMVTFQVLVHLPLISTFLQGSDLPRDISVAPMHPTFSLGAEMWCNEENTASMLMACLLMMLSNSLTGKPKGVVLEVWIHCLTTLWSRANSWRILHDSSHSWFPLCPTSSSLANQGISDSKIPRFLLEVLSESRPSSEGVREECFLDLLDSWLSWEISSSISVPWVMAPLHCTGS